jgi:hypothetical protein
MVFPYPIVYQIRPVMDISIRSGNRADTDSVSRLVGARLTLI